LSSDSSAREWGEDVLSEQHNLLTSFMRGDLRIQGMLAAAKLLDTFLRYAHLEEAKV
jgi:hypothetical protein